MWGVRAEKGAAAAGEAPFPEVTDVPHAEVIRAWGGEAFDRGEKLYRKVCFACHGLDGRKVTVEGARAFATDPLVKGTDPYSLFKTITFGFATMPQQQWLTPGQRYDVVHYIREAFLKKSNPSQYAKVDEAYLKSLPVPSGEAPQEKPGGGAEPDYGPVLCTNLNRDYPAVLTHRLDGGAAVSYDIHRMSVAGVWTGGFLDLRNTRFDRQRGEDPVKPAGERVPGLQSWRWACEGSFDYGDLPPRGPAPKAHMEYLGHYVHGDRAVMAYTVAGTPVLEMPAAWRDGEQLVIGHALEVGPGEEALKLCVVELDAAGGAAGAVLPAGSTEAAGRSAGPAMGTVAVLAGAKEPGSRGGKGARSVASVAEFHLAAAVVGDTEGLGWDIEEDRRLVLRIAPSSKRRRFQVLRHSGTGEDSRAKFSLLARESQEEGRAPDLTALTRGGPNRFPQPVTVTGALGEAINGYALDTIPVPFENPYNAWLRPGALAFFEDGRCVVVTYTGDVWIVSDIDHDLDHVTWRRYASGLYEPFGALVIDGLVYVTCRDGIKRLHDLNDDGYADYYETFFADPDVSTFFHAFCFDLHRDSKGYLYYAKSGQYTDFSKPGAVMKVAPDGESFEYFATGFRTPNGMGMLPGDRPLCSDNQGNWMPASKISLCREGGFYGYVQTHAGNGWAPDGGRIDHRKVEPPETFDPPLLWLPTRVDNSSGSQLWVDDPRFGPLGGSAGRLFHSSFGRGWVYYLMLQEVEGERQAACVTLPHQWEAGVQRLRINPADGRLYGVGLSGWQGPRGGKDGCLQRLRYTGDPCRLIDNVQVTSEGLEIRFNFELDRAAANDPSRYQLEMWNYRWGPQYGSPFFSVRAPGRKGTDRLEVTEARAAPDGRGVMVAIKDFVPCHQLFARLRVAAADGEPFEEEFYQTIHRIPGRRR